MRACAASGPSSTCASPEVRHNLIGKARRGNLAGFFFLGSQSARQRVCQNCRSPKLTGAIGLVQHPARRQNRPLRSKATAVGGETCLCAPGWRGVGAADVDGRARAGQRNAANPAPPAPRSDQMLQSRAGRRNAKPQALPARPRTSNLERRGPVRSSLRRRYRPVRWLQCAGGRPRRHGGRRVCPSSSCDGFPPCAG